MKTLFAMAAVLLALPFLASAQDLGRIPIELMSCTELQCTTRQDVFLVGEYAYVDYNSSVKEIISASNLIFPDGTTYQIMFPNRITSNTTGNYTVQMTAWKDGYQETTVSKVVQFVDKLPDQPHNPPKIDLVPVLVVIAAALTVLVVWRIRSRRKKPEHRKVSKNV